MTGAAATASPLVTGTFPAGHGNYSVGEKQQEQPNTRANTKLGWCFPGQAHLASAAAPQAPVSSTRPTAAPIRASLVRDGSEDDNSTEKSSSW